MRVEVSQQPGARLGLVAHVDEGGQRVGHVAHPGREVDAVGQGRNDEAVAVAGVTVLAGAVGLAALRHAQHDLALPPQMAFCFAGEMHRRLDAPLLKLLHLALRQCQRSETRSPAVELAGRLFQVAVTFKGDEGPGVAGGQRLPRVCRGWAVCGERN